MTEELTITMSWKTAVPLLLEIYTNAETPKARHEARDELMRCARIADQAAQLTQTARAVAEELNLWGDDTLETFNLTEVLDGLNTVLGPTTAVVSNETSPEPTEA